MYMYMIIDKMQIWTLLHVCMYDWVNGRSFEFEHIFC